MFLRALTVLVVLASATTASGTMIGDLVSVSPSIGFPSGTAIVQAGATEFYQSSTSEACGTWNSSFSIDIEATTISVAISESKGSDPLLCTGSISYGAGSTTISDIDWSEGPSVYIGDVIAPVGGPFVLEGFTGDSVTFHFTGARVFFDNSALNYGWSITAVLVPVPEPATVGLLAVGIAGLGLSRRAT